MSDFATVFSFINTMVTATLMEPQALDLSTHSRNKCKDFKPSFTTCTVTNTTTTTTKSSPKILRHNSHRNLYKPYNTRCTDDIVQGINPRNPLWPL
ncbi:Uncharacterized protein FWK35_00025443 [Aphis craccivora]|uniref:Uncharacterized protein n=1 Tax=Aphis craccivora TaxID=307492 RepID=A0A6G0YS81_APHCR|nr:Uncharacterized protein FWK35_00025443 [Aphis craccivora]